MIDSVFLFFFERAMKSLTVARDKFNVNCFIECLVVIVMFSTGLNGLKLRWRFLMTGRKE